MNLEAEVRVEDGATHAMPDEVTAVDSPGARFIIEEAMKDDPRPLHIAFYGPLTDIASALLLEPRIQNKNIRVIWIGGNACAAAAVNITSPTTFMRQTSS